MKSPNIDSLLNDLGKPGKLQCLSYLFLCMDLWIVMTYHMSSVFFVAKTGYSCKTSKNTSLIVSPTNEKEGINECFVGNSSEKCTSWNYNLPDGETTIISEVCMYDPEITCLQRIKCNGQYIKASMPYILVV